MSGAEEPTDTDETKALKAQRDLMVESRDKYRDELKAAERQIRDNCTFGSYDDSLSKQIWHLLRGYHEKPSRWEETRRELDRLQTKDREHVSVVARLDSKIAELKETIVGLAKKVSKS